LQNFLCSAITCLSLSKTDSLGEKVTELKRALKAQSARFSVLCSAEQGILEYRGFCASKFSRAIDLDRLDLAAVTMHVDSDWTTTNFAILDRGKGAE
jgi:hypothetical protein